MEKFLTLIILLTCFSFSQAWFENCNYNYSVQTTSALVLTSPNYPSRYTSGSSCKFYLTAPTGYSINLQCNYNLDTPVVDCGSQRLYVSRDGDRNLAYSEYYCGSSSFTRNSVGVEISFGYTSNPGGAGSFYCQASAVLTTQTNCQCGWSKSVSSRKSLIKSILILFVSLIWTKSRIVGGGYAQPNEYVSMAGLFDSTMVAASEGPIFCGAAISMKI